MARNKTAKRKKGRNAGLGNRAKLGFEAMLWAVGREHVPMPIQGRRPLAVPGIHTFRATATTDLLGQGITVREPRA